MRQPEQETLDQLKKWIEENNIALPGDDPREVAAAFAEEFAEGLKHHLGDVLCLLRGDMEHRTQIFEHYKAKYDEYGLGPDLVAELRQVVREALGYLHPEHGNDAWKKMLKHWQVLVDWRALADARALIEAEEKST